MDTTMQQTKYRYMDNNNGEGILKKLQREGNVQVYENPDKSYYAGRRTGQTTRLVDAYIQSLFKGELVLVTDHHDFGRNYDSNYRLYKLILSRLHLEHQWLSKNRIIVNKLNLTIRLDLSSKSIFPTDKIQDRMDELNNTIHIKANDGTHQEEIGTSQARLL